MRLRRHRPDLSERIAGRLAGLAGDLTDQLAADLAAVDHERRPATPASRYAELSIR